VTTQTLWIVVAVVVVVVLIALVAGFTISRRRKISLREPDELERTGEPKPRQGNTYVVGGGFDFSAGGGTATAEPTVPETTEPTAPEAGAASTAPPAEQSRAPQAADDLTGTADDVRTPPRGMPTGGTATEARTPPDGVPAVREPDTATPPDGVPVAETSAGPPTAAPESAAPESAAPESAPVESAVPETAPAESAVPETTPVESAVPETAPAESAVPETAPAESAVPETAPAETAPPEPIAPAEGRLERLRGNLSRSRSAFGQSLLGLLGGGELDEESWEDVEATLLQADLGPETTAEIVETLRGELARRAVRSPAEAKALLREVLVGALGTDMNRSVRVLPHDGRPGVVLVVGVNGTGKTTTTGKLARVLVAGGRTVVLGAADTFRAAAAEQLATWGERAGAAVVRGAEGADPAAVAFDAVKRGTVDGVDVVLLDTAGRLHTKTGLMDELGKVKRVVEKQTQVDEVILVLDATTGQNGMVQARVFGEVVEVTGIALTKLDGTAKGGIVFRVQRELGVPVKLVGLGEGPDDLAPFEPEAFVDALLG
jgi:fused signal recognition particle receptor